MPWMTSFTSLLLVVFVHAQQQTQSRDFEQAETNTMDNESSTGAIFFLKALQASQRLPSHTPRWEGPKASRRSKLFQALNHEDIARPIALHQSLDAKHVTPDTFEEAAEGDAVPKTGARKKPDSEEKDSSRSLSGTSQEDSYLSPHSPSEKLEDFYYIDNISFNPVQPSNEEDNSITPNAGTGIRDTDTELKSTTSTETETAHSRAYTHQGSGKSNGETPSSMTTNLLHESGFNARSYGADLRPGTDDEEKENQHTIPEQDIADSAPAEVSPEPNGNLELDSLHADVIKANPDLQIPKERRSWGCPLPEVLGGDDELWWTCRQRQQWRHLGENVYPSHLKETVCEGRTCWHGHYNCTPISYTLHVLKTCDHGCQDQRVPFPLRSRWQWLSLNVTVGCQCVR